MSIRLPATGYYRLPILEHGYRDRTTAVVIHCIEGSARGARDYFEGGTGGNPGVGAHIIMGPTPGTSWQLVRDLGLKCWHVCAGNGYTIGIEHEGYSSDGKWQWMRRVNMLRRSAARLAWICHQFNLGPPKRHHNVFSHADGGAAWGDHGDPGPGFPWGFYLAAARYQYFRHWPRGHK